MSSPSSGKQNPDRNRSDRSTDAWQRCPKGTIADLSNDLEHQQSLAQTRQRRKVVVSLCAGAGLIAVGGTSLLLLNKEKPGHHENMSGGISCSDVKKNMVAFKDGSLNKELAAKIKIHIADCSYCQSKMTA